MVQDVDIYMLHMDYVYHLSHNDKVLFTIAMAKMVGETGKVIAVDVQDKMLQIVRKKAAKEGLEPRIITHKSEPKRRGLPGKGDFALAFYMVHEVPDVEAFQADL